MRLAETDEFLTYIRTYTKKTHASRDNRVQLMITTVGQNPNLHWNIPPKSKEPRPKGSSTQPIKRNLKHLSKKQEQEQKPKVDDDILELKPLALERFTSIMGSNLPEPTELLKKTSKYSTESPQRRESPSRIATDIIYNSPARGKYSSLIPKEKEFTIESQMLSLNRMVSQSKTEQDTISSLPIQQISTISPANSPIKSRNSRPQSKQQHLYAGNRGGNSTKISANNRSFNQEVASKQRAANSTGLNTPTKRSVSNNKYQRVQLKLEKHQEFLNNFNRSYFTTKRVAPQREMEYQISIVDAQKRLLDEKLKDMPAERNPPRVNFLDDTPIRLRREFRGMSVPRKNLSVMERYNNLYFFNMSSAKDIKDPYQVNNIHVVARNTFMTQSNINSQRNSRRSLQRIFTEGNDSSLIISKIKNDSSMIIDTKNDTASSARRQLSEEAVVTRYKDRSTLALDTSDRISNLTRAYMNAIAADQSTKSNETTMLRITRY